MAQDIREIIDAIRPAVLRDAEERQAQTERTVLCVGIVFTLVFVFFLFISRPTPPLFYVLYLVFGILAYFGLRHHLLKLLNPAIEERLKILETEPETAQEFADRADLFAEYAQPEAAESDYRAALLLAPQEGGIRVKLALLLWRTSRADEALLFLEQILPIGGDEQGRAYFLHGTILQFSDLAKAEQSFNRAIEIDPDNIEFLLGRATFFEFADRDDEAAADLQEASKQLRNIGLSDTGEVCQVRGKLKLKQGDAAGAVKEFSRAIRVDPDGAPNYFLLRAQAYEVLGNLREAENDRHYAEEK